MAPSGLDTIYSGEQRRLTGSALRESRKSESGVDWSKYMSGIDYFRGRFVKRDAAGQILKSREGPNRKRIEFSRRSKTYAINENKENVIHFERPEGFSVSTLLELQS